MPKEPTNCPLCDSQCQKQYEPQNRGYFIECKRCGTYIITDSASGCNFGDTQEDKNLFSGFIRNNSSQRQPIILKSDMLSRLKEIIAPYKNVSVADKVNRIVNYVGSSSGVGDIRDIDLHYDFPLFYCKSKAELIALLNYAQGQGWLQYHLPIYPIKTTEPPQVGFPHVAKVELTFHGWQRFEANQQINIESKSVFIAMNFDKSLDEVFYQAISEACKECGFNPNRVDKSEHNEKICDRIIAEIKRARFVVAEFTGHKHGVYFEAGFAHGFGLPVIWCCRKDEVDKLHFDTRQYNHIVWDGIEDFKIKLINRIKATI